MTKFEIVKDEYREHPNIDIQLPKRATKHSAGYDFCTPVDLVVYPGKCESVKLDVKAKMNPNQVLLMYIRSSVGIKKHILLANGTGVIDSDFYGNKDNDGNMTLALYNYGKEVQIFKAGERIAQGVFVKFDTTEDDQVEKQRSGGIGSTNISGFRGGKIPPSLSALEDRSIGEICEELRKAIGSTNAKTRTEKYKDLRERIEKENKGRSE